ncbi:hypothetical protein [Halalkalicoccus jeotgali]|uniref:Uncharacterized protein n=1 Tax=Halalkalicoccus jeotgali (strain DSM 18796 / CECT 7217 / JCM 14584 / KCTC 4019 / B3) TaxID=795797 RepID=D8JAP5_HALJB|nr:hypothetical protein [Halalkalicoccus jeotgali]ADJ14767.1 hypothetical protein HacjB3_06900 [Halalkalicoccus jeotgali B3]ELY39349.1 hypothetical protein C497_05307 [Halalkalicoccus jeotgali B3]
MAWMAQGLVLLFFLVLTGQYAYREAKRENRSSPRLRGIFWIVFGIRGAVTYLVQIQKREWKRLGWIGFSLLLFAVWAVGTFGFWGLSGGFHLWGGLFAGLLVLYWQFNLEQEGDEFR